jgi:hypothetical protein
MFRIFIAQQQMRERTYVELRSRQQQGSEYPPPV